MGNGIAHVFAQHGWDTALIDVSNDALGRGLATIKKNLERLETKGAISHQLSADTLGRIRASTSLEAAKGVELVVEAVTENPNVKFEPFAAFCRPMRSSPAIRRQYRLRKLPRIPTGLERSSACTS